MKDENIELPALTADALKMIYKEQEENIKIVVNHKLPKVLDDVSQPLTFGEKAKLKEFDLRKIDTIEDEKLDELLLEFTEMRGVENLNDLKYSDLQMWIRKVVLTTFNIRAIDKKK